MSNVSNAGGSEPNNATSKTTFGLSMESHAQISDNTKIAASLEGEILNVYRLVPIAAADDPNWDNSPASGEVIVAARTAGDARIVATSRELDFTEVSSAPAEGVTTSNASAYRNEKLYSVVEIEQRRSDLKRGVLEGTVSVGNIKPTEI